MNVWFRFPAFLVAVGLVATALAQEDPKPSPQSDAYNKYRHELTQPLYGTAKVKALIAKIRTDSEDNRTLPEAAYRKLTMKEKFAFVMLHGENFSQNCDMMPRILDEHKKIFPYFPSPFGDEAVWSERQRSFLTGNRRQVISMIRETVQARKRVGVNLKAAIAAVNGKELVPDVIKVYRRDRKDHDLLTLLMVLMGEARYRPFTGSALYKTLYGEEASYQANVPYDVKTETQILNWATAFAKQ